MLDALDTALLTFQSSPELEAHYQDRAEAAVLSINAADVSSRKRALLRDAGLGTATDATVLP